MNGPFALAVAISDTVDDGITSDIVWVSSAALVDDQTNTQVSGGNQDFFLNALGYLCQAEQSSLSIHAKSLSSDTLTMDSAAVSALTVAVVGVIPAVVAWVIRNKLHEPEVFTARDPKDQPSAMQCLKLLMKDKATTKVSLGVIVLTSVQNFGYYGIMIWMPSFLSKQMGFSLTKSSMWTAATIIGMSVGIWVFGQMADRIGRKPTFLIFQVGSVISVLTYSQLSEPTAMLWVGAIMGLFVNGMMGGYGAVISEAYPTEARATAQNVLFNIGRAVGGFGPVVIGALAMAYSFQVAIALLAAIYVLDMLATAFLIPELKGKELQ